MITTKSTLMRNQSIGSQQSKSKPTEYQSNKFCKNKQRHTRSAVSNCSGNDSYLSTAVTTFTTFQLFDDMSQQQSQQHVQPFTPSLTKQGCAESRKNDRYSKFKSGFWQQQSSDLRHKSQINTNEKDNALIENQNSNESLKYDQQKNNTYIQPFEFQKLCLKSKKKSDDYNNNFNRNLQIFTSKTVKDVKDKQHHEKAQKNLRYVKKNGHFQQASCASQTATTCNSNQSTRSPSSHTKMQSQIKHFKIKSDFCELAPNVQPNIMKIESLIQQSLALQFQIQQQIQQQKSKKQQYVDAIQEMQNDNRLQMVKNNTKQKQLSQIEQISLRLKQTNQNTDQQQREFNKQKEQLEQEIQRQEISLLLRIQEQKDDIQRLKCDNGNKNVHLAHVHQMQVIIDQLRGEKQTLLFQAQQMHRQIGEVKRGHQLIMREIKNNTANQLLFE